MSRSRCAKASQLLRGGLTLVELVVVLAILAILAGVAVRSLQPLADQARYEASQKTLSGIETAFLGVKTSSGSDVTYSGFIVDIGRLPQGIGLDAETLASELWNNDRVAPLGAPDLPLFAITPFDDPNTTVDESKRLTRQILVAAGWRGPYLSLSSISVRDGYGRAMTYLDPNGNLAVDGSPIAGVVSRGSNNIIDPTDIGYARDLSMPNGLWLPARFQGTLPVRATTADGTTPPTLKAGERIVVRVYGPDQGLPAVIGEVDLTAGGTPEFGGVLPALISGTRAVRALKVTGNSPNETIVEESLVRQVTIHPGMNAEIVLRLP